MDRTPAHPRQAKARTACRFGPGQVASEVADKESSFDVDLSMDQLAYIKLWRIRTGGNLDAGKSGDLQ